MATDKPRLLYLDDEENNLIAFKALFRRDYDIFTTSSPQEAMAFLNETEVQVMLSDQKMPDVSGVEFFEMTLNDFPHAVRVLVTGYADMEAVIDAINKGQVYRYVTKPWDENDLKICINNAVEKYDREKELRLKTERLEKANAELERFVYSASHDLRAPLVSMRGVIQLAGQDITDAQALSYMGMIDKSAKKLDQFLQNIIHYYQNLKSDELITEVSLDRVLDDIIDKHTAMDMAEGVSFTKAVAASAPLKMDEHRLKMALSNVISNAIRFQDAAKETKKVDIEAVVNTEKVIIKVEDNGLGMPPEIVPRVFEMFFRDGDMSIGAGTGIGLYIAKEATEKLGGKITVSSELGIGSRFTLEIPNKA
jgi:two-component system, sensor histidine kinase and response regulator